MIDLIEALEMFHHPDLKSDRDWELLKKEIANLQKHEQTMKELEHFFYLKGWQKLKDVINSTGHSSSFRETLEEINNKCFT